MLGFILASAALMQAAPTLLPMPENGDFARSEAGVPAGWVLNRSRAAPVGMTLTVTPSGHAHIVPTTVSAGQWTRLIQRIDATPWRGKVIRLSARVRVIDAGEHVGLRLSVFRPEPLLGFYDQMNDAPIGVGDWRSVSLTGVVEDDATFIDMGVMFRGHAEIEIDDVVLAEVPDDGAPLSAEARAYLDRAIGFVRTRHMDSARVDWSRVTARAYRHAAGAVTTADTYPALRGVLSALGDNHSHLSAPPRSAPAADTGVPAAPAPQPLPTYRLIDGRFGLLALPALDMIRPEQTPHGRAYVLRLREGLAAFDRPGLCGWIVDVRGNTGGNMWPMLNGLTPLLGRPPFGAFVGGEYERPSRWTLNRGLVTIEGEDMREMGLGIGAFTNRRGQAPVAVLTGPETASSGEAVVVAFAGRPDSRSFGRPTGGYVSANVTETLSDGAILGVPASWEADRTGREYRTAIAPDELIEDGGELNAAKRWLDAQCQSRTEEAR